MKKVLVLVIIGVIIIGIGAIFTVTNAEDQSHFGDFFETPIESKLSQKIELNEDMAMGNP